MNHKVFEKYRIKRKLSKKELAEKVGRTPSWYSKLISGQVHLRSKLIIPMAEALGISPKKLTTEYFSEPELEDTSSNDGKIA